MPETSAKPARSRTAATKTKTKTPRTRTVGPVDIATRAYYIYLDEGSNDELDNWLRAERELTAA